MYYADTTGELFRATILEDKETHLRIRLDNGFEMDFHEGDFHILTPDLNEAYLFAQKEIKEDLNHLLDVARNEADKDLSNLKAKYIKYKGL